MNKNSETTEISFSGIIKLLIEKLWIVAVCTVATTAVAFLYTQLFIAPKYHSEFKVYVNNDNEAVGSSNITQSDLTTSKELVARYTVILKSRSTLGDVIERAEVDLTYEQLSGMISAGSVNNTEILSIVVTDTDPERAAKLANTIADVLPARVISIMDASSVKIIDYAEVSDTPVSPSVMKNTVIGFALGLIASCGLIVLFSFVNPYIKDEEYIADAYSNIPILSVIPDISSDGKKKYGSAYYKRYGSGYYYKNYGYYGKEEEK